MISVDFDKMNGLVPVVVQEKDTNIVLMLAYANKEALDKTLKTGLAHYYSRSRKELWLKGGTSGHTQSIVEIKIDCDEDTLLYIVEQKGGSACHTGAHSCFYRSLT